MSAPRNAPLVALERWASERVLTWSPGRALLVGVLGVVVAGAIDYLVSRFIGHGFAVTALYVAPIGVAGWAGGRRSGWLIAALAAAVEAGGAQLRLGGPASAWSFGGGAILDLLVFMGVADLLALSRQHLENERKTSRTDALTGIANSRAFFEGAAVELERSRRRGTPISAAYFDIDEFKAVNDLRGHAAGDTLLKVVGESLRGSVRGHDIAARLGGDEFVLLLTETGPDQARFAVERIRRRLGEALAATGLDVSASVGVVTFLSPPPKVEELVGVTDRAMYSVKHGKKGGVRYEVVAAPATPPEPRWQRERARA